MSLVTPKYFDTKRDMQNFVPCLEVLKTLKKFMYYENGQVSFWMWLHSCESQFRFACFLFCEYFRVFPWTTLEQSSNSLKAALCCAPFFHRVQHGDTLVLHKILHRLCAMKATDMLWVFSDFPSHCAQSLQTLHPLGLSVFWRFFWCGIQCASYTYADTSNF